MKSAHRSVGEKWEGRSPRGERGLKFPAYYGEKAPILYAQVGARHEPFYPHHNPRFDIDEKCMEQSTAFFVGFAMEFLND